MTSQQEFRADACSLYFPQLEGWVTAEDMVELVHGGYIHRIMRFPEPYPGTRSSFVISLASAAVARRFYDWAQTRHFARRNSQLFPDIRCDWGRREWAFDHDLLGMAERDGARCSVSVDKYPSCIGQIDLNETFMASNPRDRGPVVQFLRLETQGNATIIFDNIINAMIFKTWVARGELGPHFQDSKVNYVKDPNEGTEIPRVTALEEQDSGDETPKRPRIKYRVPAPPGTPADGIHSERTSSGRMIGYHPPAYGSQPSNLQEEAPETSEQLTVFNEDGEIEPTIGSLPTSRVVDPPHWGKPIDKPAKSAAAPAVETPKCLVQPLVDLLGPDNLETGRPMPSVNALHMLALQKAINDAESPLGRHQPAKASDRGGRL